MVTGGNKNLLSDTGGNNVHGTRAVHSKQLNNLIQSRDLE